MLMANIQQGHKSNDDAETTSVSQHDLATFQEKFPPTLPPAPPTVTAREEVGEEPSEIKFNQFRMQMITIKWHGNDE